MSNITDSSVRSRFNSLVRNRSNNGISWGTNNYPNNALSSWFGGNTSGITGTAFNGFRPEGTTAEASDLRAALLEQTREYARIKRMRIRIRRQRTRGKDESLETIYDNTAVAHALSGNAQSVSAPGNNGVVANTDASFSQVESYLQSLWSNLSSARSHVTTRTREVCHNSCHNSCHGSRSRR